MLFACEQGFRGKKRSAFRVDQKIRNSSFHGSFSFTYTRTYVRECATTSALLDMVAVHTDHRPLDPIMTLFGDLAVYHIFLRLLNPPSMRGTPFVVFSRFLFVFLFIVARTLARRVIFLLRQWERELLTEYVVFLHDACWFRCRVSFTCWSRIWKERKNVPNIATCKFFAQPRLLCMALPFPISPPPSVLQPPLPEHLERHRQSAICVLCATRFIWPACQLVQNIVSFKN